MNHHALTQSYRHAVEQRVVGNDETGEVGEHVTRLRQRGFLVRPLPNLLGYVDGLYLHRFTSNGYIDTMVIRAQDCAVAARVHNNFDVTTPLREARPVWSKNGTLAEVANELLEQDEADDEARFAGQLDIPQRF